MPLFHMFMVQQEVQIDIKYLVFVLITQSNCVYLQSSTKIPTNMIGKIKSKEPKGAG